VVRPLPYVLVSIVVCRSLGLVPILAIDLVNITLLLVAGAARSIVLTVSALARVRRVIRIVIRALIVVPVLIVLQVLAVIAAILRFHRVDLVVFVGATWSLRRTTARGQHLVTLPVQSFISGIVRTVVRPLAYVVVFMMMCGCLSLVPILAIDVVNITMPIVAGAVLSTVRAASARVRRVIRIVIRALIVDLMAFIGDIPKLVRATCQALVVDQPERLPVVKAMLSFSGVVAAVFAVAWRVHVAHRPSPRPVLRKAVLVVADDQLAVVNAVPSLMCRTRLIVLNGIIRAFVVSLARMLRARGQHPINLRILLRASHLIQVARKHVAWSAIATFVPVIPGCTAAAVS